MKRPSKSSRWLYGAMLLALAGLITFAAWAPVPPRWRVDVQIGLGLLADILLVGVVWYSVRGASASDRRHVQRRRSVAPKTAQARRTVPLTAVQRHFLEVMDELDTETARKSERRKKLQ